MRDNLERKSKTERVLSDEEVTFINKVSAEFLQTQRERLVDDFINELTDEGKAYIENLMEKRKDGTSKEDLVLSAFIFKLSDEERKKLITIAGHFPDLNFIGVGLHHVGNAINFVVGMVSLHKSTDINLFKNLPNN